MRYFKHGTLLIIGVLLIFTWTFPQFFRCLFVAQDNFNEIKPMIFVEKGISKNQKDTLIKNIVLAKKRIIGFWGKQEGIAKIIFCKNAETYKKYCQSSEGAGCSIGTPLGSWIILNTDGLNVDVIAHEMCHDELMTRLGWWKTKKHIPTWFDEGLALMLDQRFVSSQDSSQRYIDYRAELNYLTSQPIPLQELTTQKAFFGQNQLFTKVAYFSSAVAISQKISTKGKKEIFEIIEKTKKEDKFEF
ncbi:hypothetical protein [Emticicia sp. SJ17W-69]|uniref:hypothetical protein n=1 Tax=Emticicia sp. SJ17W-69 TaxID=3421657 RepID=UPI003EBA51FB